jgi:dimethylhistidine N-methyltransferase
VGAGIGAGQPIDTDEVPRRAGSVSSDSAGLPMTGARASGESPLASDDSAAAPVGLAPADDAAEAIDPAPRGDEAFRSAQAAAAFSVAETALRGLLASRKTLPPSLFYDGEGCRLFYEITKLPEYYLTRTEFGLLETTAPAVAALFPVGATLVEYGASEEAKATMLLGRTARSGRFVFRTYIPIDVAAPALVAMQARLEGRHNGLTVLPVVADFMEPIVLPARNGETDILGFFPGSTIGNLEPDAATAFLRRARATLGPKARFLLGFDTCRDPARLLPAYDDRKGVTAAFNRNLLVRLNREAAATFDPSAFAHRAVWNEAESRIEMHLVSRAEQTVILGGRQVHFDRDESIHTENSYKYSPDRMRTMTEAADWSFVKSWTDRDGVFALWLLG